MGCAAECAIHPISGFHGYPHPYAANAATADLLGTSAFRYPWLHPLALPESPIIGSNTETKENLFATNLELPCLIYLEQQGSSCGISIYPKRRKKVGLRPQTFRIIFSDSNNVDRLLAGIKKVLCSFLFMCVDMGIRICLCCHICAT
jgi:hypothetical protein